MTRSPTPPPAWARRPDGRVQVGVGPGAWLVTGLAGDHGADEGVAALLSRLAQTGSVPRAPGSRTAGPGGSGAEGPGDSRAKGPRVSRAEDPGDPRPTWQVLGAGRLADRLRRVAPSPSPSGDPAETAPSPPRADPVVLVCTHLVPVGTAARADLQERRLLPVVTQSARVVVGPWTGSADLPCLHCLDLGRRDRDPGWPHLATLLDDPLSLPPEPHHPEAVLEVVQALVDLLLTATAAPDQVRALPALSYEVGPGPPHLVTRRWGVHPSCPWHRRGGRPG